MTPLENEQYNKSIEATLDRNPSLKRKMVKRLEMALDIAFFPTAAPVCRIINGFYTGEKTSVSKSESFDTRLFQSLISDASEKMANVLGLDRLITDEPHNLFFFPATYKALSDGKSTDEVNNEHAREKQYLINQIDREGLTVERLYKVLSKTHMNTGITVRNRRFYMQSFEDYFQSLISSGQGGDTSLAGEIRNEIVRLINLYFRL
jgi:CRISPR/Cas system CSM-associated protein Csm2 small subunit